MSDDFLNDEDLLSMLENSVSDKSSNDKEDKSDVEKAMSSDNSTPKKISEEDISAIADIMGSSANGNPGSGNLDTDLSNWFDGVDSLPSDGLNSSMSNSSVKLEYGLTHTTLTSFGIMNKLRKFIEEDAFDILFSEQAILGIDAEEVLDRVKVAFTMYKELGNLAQRTVQNQRDYKLKSGSESADADRLTMLLSTIPSEKLEKTLKEIAFGDLANKN